MTETRAEITLKFSGVMPSAKPAANKKVEIQLTAIMVEADSVPIL